MSDLSVVEIVSDHGLLIHSMLIAPRVLSIWPGFLH